MRVDWSPFASSCLDILVNMWSVLLLYTRCVNVYIFIAAFWFDCFACKRNHPCDQDFTSFRKINTSHALALTQAKIKSILRYKSLQILLSSKSQQKLCLYFVRQTIPSCISILAFKLPRNDETVYTIKRKMYYKLIVFQCETIALNVQ